MHLSILLLVILTVLHHAHAQQQVQLSLEGGPDSNSGRVVVIWYSSTRGTICSDGFDNNDAAVICRILGKSSNGAVARSFGAGSGTIIMSRLGCRGHEQGLLDCPVGSWAPRTGCQHSQDAGVVCGGSSPQVTSAPFTQRPRPNPTPGPAAGCRDSFLVRQNRVAPNAGRFPALTTTACSNACLASNPTCYGYDWRGACYINLNSSNSNNLQAGTGTNYERTFSCRTPAPPANGPGSCRDRFITYQNQYVVSGAFVQTSSTQDCANKCLQSSLRCRGYGIWDRIWCFLVLYTHRGNDVVFDTRWTRYQRVFSCPSSVPTPTPLPPPSPPRAPVQAFLVDGTDYLHGRVVLQYNGVNGTVCDDSFDYNDARVICRMLGYFGSDVSAAGNTFGAGSSSMRIWLDDLACRGTERDVSACSHRGWGSHNCGHNEDVSVVCGHRVFRDPPVRVALEGGSDRLHGRLVVAYNNQPGTVCNDNFGTDDARVVCRMLGYMGSSVSVTSRYGPGSGRIWLDNVFCHGNESSISDCFYPPLGTHDCSHSNDVGINCGPSSVSLRVFLVGGQDHLHGQVVLQYNGVNGTVCDDRFDYNDARVICRMLGYFGSDVSAAGNTFGTGPSSMRIWLDDLACRGTERDVSACSHRGWGSHDCSHTEDVSVVCGRRVSRDPPVRVALQGGSDRLHGRLVVAYNNQPGTVCNDNFGTDDARVVCRMLGYRGSSISVTRRYGPGSGRIWLDNVFCHGNESSISDCFYPPLGTHDCSHSDDVGINCGFTTFTTPATVPRTTPAPPTASFILEGSGRVVLQLNGIRGYICSDGFGLTDARVVCRSFGRPSTNAQIRNFPHTSGIVWLTNVQCTGFESRIDQCRFDAEVVITNCRSGQNIGVVCGTSQFPTTRGTAPRPTPGPTLPPSGSAPFCSGFGSKIYGGGPAQQLGWPEIVKVQTSKDGITSHCGGSIISRQWILTAAHCLFRYKGRRPTILIIAGTTNLQRGGVRVLANGFAVHPSYRNGSNTHDVAVIRLGRLLDLGTSIRTVCLNTVRNAIPAGSCYTAGWGRLREGQTTRTQILQTTRYPIVSDSQCRHVRGYNNDALICAGFSSGSATTCPGDSGGPLGCFVGNSYSQWGIASTAAPNSCGGRNAQVTTWTEVAQYVSWIRSTTGL